MSVKTVYAIEPRSLEEGLKWLDRARAEWSEGDLVECRLCLSHLMALIRLVSNNQPPKEDL